MHPKHWLLTGLAILATFLVFALTQAQAPQHEQCPHNTFLSLSREEQERCIQEAGGKPGFVATVEAVQIATALSRPSVVAFTTPRPTPTTTPIGYAPAYAERIGPASNAGQDFRGTQSIWIVGAVQNADGRHFPFFVYTRERHCSIGTLVPSEGFDATFVPVAANQHWDCPDNKGILTITDVTSSTGVVSFATTQRQTGAFDLATEEWTLAGTPWLPAATPTPTP